MRQCVSSGTSSRYSLFVGGDLEGRAAHITQEDLEEKEVIALLGLRLTPCQWSILHLLLAHPLLSDEELAAFLSLQRKSVRCSLYELHQLGCLGPIETIVGKRWHLCDRGLRLMAAANHLHIGNIAARPDEKAHGGTSIIKLRGEDWLLQRIGHTAGIYSFFARLALAAKRETEQALSWWETGAVCERRYQVSEQWYNLRPDALAEYQMGQQRARFWLEWDRGTMNVRDLAIKFTSYAQYIASREWAREDPMLPVLLCVAPEIGQERRMQRVALARLTSPAGLMVWTTTGVLLNELGPLAPIWLQSSQATQSGGSLRQHFSDVIPGKYGW